MLLLLLLREELLSPRCCGEPRGKHGGRRGRPARCSFNSAGRCSRRGGGRRPRICASSSGSRWSHRRLLLLVLQLLVLLLGRFWLPSTIFRLLLPLLRHRRGRLLCNSRYHSHGRRTTWRAHRQRRRRRPTTSTRRERRPHAPTRRRRCRRSSSSVSSMFLFFSAAPEPLLRVSAWRRDHLQGDKAQFARPGVEPGLIVIGEEEVGAAGRGARMKGGWERMRGGTRVQAVVAVSVVCHFLFSSLQQVAPRIAAAIEAAFKSTAAAEKRTARSRPHQQPGDRTPQHA